MGKHHDKDRYKDSLITVVAQRLKCLPSMQETWVQSLGLEDSLEKEMATHSSILAWRIPWAEKFGTLLSAGLQNESDTAEWLSNNKDMSLK